MGKVIKVVFAMRSSPKTEDSKPGSGLQFAIWKRLSLETLSEDAFKSQITSQTPIKIKIEIKIEIGFDKGEGGGLK